jgi:hypothetical protein
LVAVLPFSFNQTIEKAVDDTIDRSLEDMRAIGTRVSKDVKDWQSKHHKPKSAAPCEAAEQPSAPAEDKSATDVDPEDPSRFMPK